MFNAFKRYSVITIIFAKFNFLIVPRGTYYYEFV